MLVHFQIELFNENKSFLLYVHKRYRKNDIFILYYYLYMESLYVKLFKSENIKNEFQFTYIMRSIYNKTNFDGGQKQGMTKK